MRFYNSTVFKRFWTEVFTLTSSNFLTVWFTDLEMVLNKRKFKNLWNYPEKKFIDIFFLCFLWSNEKVQLFLTWLLQFWPSALYPYVISKRIKLQQPAWSHFEALLKSFKTVMDFAMFFSLDECETLKNILSLLSFFFLL